MNLIKDKIPVLGLDIIERRSSSEHLAFVFTPILYINAINDQILLSYAKLKIFKIDFINKKIKTKAIGNYTLKQLPQES